jgi:hypothetical protein
MRLSNASRGRRQRLFWRGVILAAALASSGCALNGDFDRVRPGLRSDDMHDWVGRDAVASIGLPASDSRLTDDERSLRDLAFAMIDPPYDRNRWDSVFREYGLGRSARDPIRFDQTEYWKRLADIWRTSEASAYAQLVSDARNDVIRIEPFFAIAGRVADMDRKRKAALAHAQYLKQAEHDNALFRNNENTAVVDWVCRSLNARWDAYRYALERMMIQTPFPQAAEAERALALLQTRVAQACPALPGNGLVAKS